MTRLEKNIAELKTALQGQELLSRLTTGTLSNYDGEMKKPTKKVRCPKCNSTLAYFRIKRKEFICRSCGHTFKDK